MLWQFFNSILLLLFIASPAFAEWERWQGTMIIHEAEFSGPINVSWDEGIFNFSFTSSEGTTLESTGTLQDAGGGGWVMRSVYADCTVNLVRNGNVVTAQEIVSCAGSVSNMRFTKLAE